MSRHHLHMRHHTENAALEFALKAVHHRTDNHQCQHAEKDAQSGEQVNKSDKAVRLAGAAIAQPDKEAKRMKHRDLNAAGGPPEMAP